MVPARLKRPGNLYTQILSGSISSSNRRMVREGPRRHTRPVNRTNVDDSPDCTTCQSPISIIVSLFWLVFLMCSTKGREILNAIEVDDVGDHGVVPAIMSESSESTARPIVFPKSACYRSETKSGLNTEIARGPELVSVVTTTSSMSASSTSAHVAFPSTVSETLRRCNSSWAQTKVRVRLHVHRATHNKKPACLSH